MVSTVSRYSSPNSVLHRWVVDHDSSSPVHLPLDRPRVLGAGGPLGDVLDEGGALRPVLEDQGLHAAALQQRHLDSGVRRHRRLEQLGDPTVHRFPIAALRLQEVESRYCVRVGHLGCAGHARRIVGIGAVLDADTPAEERQAQPANPAREHPGTFQGRSLRRFRHGDSLAHGAMIHAAMVHRHIRGRRRLLFGRRGAFRLASKRRHRAVPVQQRHQALEGVLRRHDAGRGGGVERMDGRRQLLRVAAGVPRQEEALRRVQATANAWIRS